MRTILLISVLQRLIIIPLLRLTNFATQVGKGIYDEALPGNFILELGMLKTDILQMVSTLRLKMNQADAQIKVIKEREASLESGYSYDPVMADYTKYGFKAVEVKPYQITDLEKAVQKTLLTRQA